MPVSSFVTVTVADFYITAVTAVPACVFHITGCACVNRRTVVVADINAGVVIVTCAAERVGSAAEAGSNFTAGRRPDVRSSIELCIAFVKLCQQIAEHCFFLLHFCLQVFSLGCGNINHFNVRRGGRAAFAHVLAAVNAAAGRLLAYIAAKCFAHFVFQCGKLSHVLLHFFVFFLQFGQLLVLRCFIVAVSYKFVLFLVCLVNNHGRFCCNANACQKQNAAENADFFQQACAEAEAFRFFAAVGNEHNRIFVIDFTLLSF